MKLCRLLMWVMPLEGDKDGDPDRDGCPDYNKQAEFSPHPLDQKNNRQSVLNIINERDEGAESNDEDCANLHLSAGRQPIAESRGDLTICGDYAIPGLMIYEQDQEAVAVYNDE